MKMGPICCSETSVRYYHYMLRNIAEECRSLLFCCFVLGFYLDNLYGTSARLFFKGNIHRSSKAVLSLFCAITPLRMRLFALASHLLHCGVGPHVVTINPALHSSFVSQRVSSFRLSACIIIISHTGHRK